MNFIGQLVALKKGKVEKVVLSITVEEKAVKEAVKVSYLKACYISVTNSLVYYRCCERK